jgi:hypothetical protein
LKFLANIILRVTSLLSNPALFGLFCLLVNLVFDLLGLSRYFVSRLLEFCNNQASPALEILNITW